MYNRKEYMKEYNKRYWEEHKEFLLDYNKKRYLKIREQKVQYSREYRKNNKERVKRYDTIYRKNHPEIIKIISKRGREKRKLLDIEKVRKVAREKWRKRVETDLNFKLLGNLRARVHLAIKNNYKGAHTIELVGCSIEQLKSYLESKFKLGMSWDNWGNGWNGKGLQEWNIDHIKPCASFDLSKPEEQKLCFHYTNLQPLWAQENWDKNDKY